MSRSINGTGPVTRVLVAACALSAGACIEQDLDSVKRSESALNGMIEWGTFSGALCTNAAQQARFKANFTSAMNNYVKPWVVPTDSAHRDKMLACLKEGIFSGEVYNSDSGGPHEDITNPETIMARMALNNKTRIHCNDPISASCASGGFVNGAEDLTCTGNYGNTDVTDPVVRALAGVVGHEIAHRFWDHPFQGSSSAEYPLTVNEQVSKCIRSLVAGDSPGIPNGPKRSILGSETTLAPIAIEVGTPALPTYCPGNQFLTGLFGNAGSGAGQFVNRLGGFCRPLDDTQETDMQSVGSAAGTSFHDTCPSGTVAVGFFGKAAAVADTLGALPTTSIDSIGTVCQTLSNVQSGSTSGRTDDTLHGGSGGTDWRRLCPVKQAVKGLRLRGDSGVKRVEVVCQDLTQSNLAPMRQTQLAPVGGSGSFRYFENCQSSAVVTGVNVKQRSTGLARLGATCQGVTPQASDVTAFDLSSGTHVLASHSGFLPTPSSNDFFDSCGAGQAVVGMTVFTQSAVIAGVRPDCAPVLSWSNRGDIVATPGTLRGTTTSTSAHPVCGAREFVVGWDIQADTDGLLHGLTPVCRRFGPTAASNPRGYIRSDGKHAVVARSLNGHVIELLTQASGPQTFSDLTRAAGTSVNANGDVWGYKRSDNVDTVVYRGTDDHLHEIAPAFSLDGDLTAIAGGPAMASNPMAIQRSDGRNSIVYRGSNNHLIEVVSNFPSSPAWLSTDMTSFVGAPNAAGNPMLYLRADNTNAMIYRDSSNYIHETRSNFGGSPAWIDTDLFTASGETVASASDPWGYVRGDGMNAVVYRGTDGKIHELAQTGSSWQHGVLPSTSATGNPTAYARWDGTSAVVYQSNATTTGAIRELALSGGAWGDASLDGLDRPGAGPNGSPFGHRTPTPINSVVYLGKDAGVYQHRLATGGVWGSVTY